MAAKIHDKKIGELASKAFYNLLKTDLSNNALYAGVSYVEDSEWKAYTGSNDSESTFWGGFDSEYGPLDKSFYDQTMYSMHKVLPGGINRVIRRIDWESGTVYKSYPHSNSYALVKAYDSGYVTLNVYRCLFSPGTASVYPPSTTSNVPITLSDGYVWKYLYTVTNSQSIRFLNDRWMPVVERITQEEIDNINADSVNYAQYISQINAEVGAVYDVVLDSDTLMSHLNTDSDFRVSLEYGSTTLIGLDNKLNKPSKTFKLRLTKEANANKFSKTLVEAGSGYVGPISMHLDSDSTAIPGLISQAAPGEGHGANIPSELGTKHVMISVRSIADEVSEVAYNGSFYNLLTLHQNPIDRNTGNIATDEFYITCNYLELDEPLDYAVGDIIKPFFNDDGRRGMIISNVNGKAYYISPKQGREFDVFQDSETICLEDGNKRRTVKKSYMRDIIYGSSDLLAADYKETAIIRNKGQIESFNFILGF